jgi:hypothetical protein
VFHFPPSELWELEIDDLMFWLDRAKWANQRHG